MNRPIIAPHRWRNMRHDERLRALDISRQDYRPLRNRLYSTPAMRSFFMMLLCNGRGINVRASTVGELAHDAQVAAILLHELQIKKKFVKKRKIKK